MYDLTFVVNGTLDYIENFTVNNTNYTLNDFTMTTGYVYNLTLQFASGTNISWSVTSLSEYNSFDPSSGSFTISSDTTITIYSSYEEGGKG